MGYVVYPPVASGEEAVDKAREYNPTLILMDVGLAGSIDGIEAALRIRARARIPIVYVTAFSDDATLARIKKVAGYGCVLKPFEDEDLRQVIDQALGYDPGPT
jgi:CheY-like chemotaxis protein